MASTAETVKSKSYIRWRCPICEKKLRARSSVAGQKIVCPNCDRPVRVPRRTSLSRSDAIQRSVEAVGIPITPLPSSHVPPATLLRGPGESALQRPNGHVTAASVNAASAAPKPAATPILRISPDMVGASVFAPAIVAPTTQPSTPSVAPLIDSRPQPSPKPIEGKKRKFFRSLSPIGGLFLLIVGIFCLLVIAADELYSLFDSSSLSSLVSHAALMIAAKFAKLVLVGIFLRVGIAIAVRSEPSALQ